MTTTEDYNKEIKRLEGEIAYKKSQAEEYRRLAQTWYSDADRTKNCTGGKNAKAKCEAENNRKIGIADGYLNQSKSFEDQVKEHESRVNELRALAKAAALTDSEVAKILANQGQTVNSVKVFAEKQGEAEIQRQTLVGQAEAQKVNDQSKTNKTIGYVVLGLVGIGALIGLAFLVKKLRK